MIKAWELFGRLALVRPAGYRAIVSFYAGYAVSAIALVFSLYLFLPVLRHADTEAKPLLDYEIGFFHLKYGFSLYWWVPFVLVILSAALLAISKRLEYRIWTVAHREFWQRYHAVFKDSDGDRRMLRIVDRAAKARAFALRWLALLGLELVKSIVLMLLILFLQPAVFPILITVLVVLMVIFRDAIWRESPNVTRESRPDTHGLHDLVHHRIRLTNAQQILSALMPITILALLLGPRLGFGLSFDLADLVFLSFLLSTLGVSLSSAIQNLIRVQQLDEHLLAGWEPLSRGEKTAFVMELERARGFAPGWEGADD